MYAEVDKFGKKVNVYSDEEDLCYLCRYMDECPLIDSLKKEIIVLRYENVEIGTCDMFEELRLEEMIAF